MLSAERLLLLALSIAACGCAKSSASEVASAAGPEPISFLSIAVDAETADADTRLKRFLERAITKGFEKESGGRHIRFTQQTMPYGEVIRAFAERDRSRRYLARITPYAYVAAEMLGADLKILATYRSVSTSEMTYRSYFVVRRDRFKEHTKWVPGSRDATLEDVAQYLKNLKDAPAKFVYHDRFSTSSYFLPSLYFKTSHVFAMRRSINPDLIPIEVAQFPSTSSTELIAQVFNRKADLAAVWDGTRTKFEGATDAGRRAIADQILFVPIPTQVPNDFLVASGIDSRTEQLIVKAVEAEPGAGRPCTSLEDPPSSIAKPRKPCKDAKLVLNDDFDAWYAWDGQNGEVSDDAREALARLRHDARQRPTSVVVKVEAGAAGGNASDEAILHDYVKAAREAVRLSGTEFVLEDGDLHKRADMTWTLESTHDGALMLTSTLDSVFGQSAETFPISFADDSDLPQRIAELVRSRMRRIRYVWPYEQKYPAVLRDLDFTPDERVLVQRISWMDPGRNEYEEDMPFAARIENNTDFSKLRLSDEIKFPRNSDGSFNFDPMSNVAYRVIISREPHASWIWVVLPYSFIGLFALAAAGLAVDLRRRQPPPKGLHHTYRRMVEAYHLPWRTQPIEEGAILWADPKYLDEFVKEIRSAGSLLDAVRTGGLDFNFGPLPVKLSLLVRLGSRLVGRGPQLSSDLIESSGAGSVMALDTLIQFLVRRRRLSPFVGFPEAAVSGQSAPARPIEWDALNDIARRHFQQLGICDGRMMDSDFGARGTALSAVVASHFRGVIRKATREASLFCQTWEVREAGTPGRLAYTAELRSPLLLRNEHSAAAAGQVRVEVKLPSDAALSQSLGTGELRAWVFGKILEWSVEQGTLFVQVKPIAILKDHDHAH